MDVRRDWFVGVDWATVEHQVCVEDPAGRVIGERVFSHSGTGLTELCDWLASVTGAPADHIAVAIEIPHGPVVETLLERGFQVFAVNPKQLDRFRDRFTLAGAKDDRRDARVLASSLRTDAQRFRALDVADPQVIQLREWSRMADELKNERNRLANRVREQLRRYYPQMLGLHGDVTDDWMLALWDLVPTPAAARSVRRVRIARLLKGHRIRKVDADGILARLRETPVHVADGTTDAVCAHIRALAERLRVVNRQLRDAERRIEEFIAAVADAGGDESSEGQKCEQRDVEILRSLPGVGTIILGTLLAEAWRPLQNRDYHALRALTAAAPVTRRSGKRSVVVMRQACHPRLRDALFHWARVASQVDPRSRARYAELRARGKKHARALRSVGDRLLSVACAMLRNQEVFDPLRCLPHQPSAAA